MGASAAGTETLKNLVLPGIGAFRVIDDALVCKDDAASNFFLPITGKSRAETAAEYLSELNPDVAGSFQHVPSLNQVTDWNTLLLKEAADRKIVVIACDLDPPVLETLSKVCTAGKISLLVIHSYGLVGILRLQLPELVPLLDPKPTNAHPDLQLLKSFPALDAMSHGIDFEALDDHQYGHVPYPIILHKALHEWKDSHQGKTPSSFGEKQEFQAFVKAKRRNDNQINFDEAVQNAYLAYTQQNVEIPENLDPSSTLGMLYRGLQTFMNQSQGRVPLNGAIPDMTANTDWYVQLQKIYKDQADADLETMKALCIGVPEDAIANFCANIFTVQQIQTRSLLEEFRQTKIDGDLLDEWKMALMDPYEVPEHTPLLWYLGVRACQEFFNRNGRYPGSIDNWESDVPLLLGVWMLVVEQYGLHEQDLVRQHSKNICQELTRYSNAEIHNIASVVGGIASQEAVKIITGQYIPLDNTYVFNGIVSVAGIYKF